MVFDFRQGRALFSTAIRPAVEPNQTPIQSVPEAVISA